MLSCVLRSLRRKTSAEAICCVPGTARILKGEYISCYRYITSPRPSLMEAKGVAVWQAGGSINTRGESRSVKAEYRKCMG